ncbi:acyl- N-acyltransferase [Pyrenophora seminiperda CCB06]|uniref:Acyl-N-acyltransferase n=1 Tax=Pyrenophora seminiperda CCB06 TaxID=1302712 RepID=A0A3M7MBJ3_9PLEO|nr:acyl- N-acyltransferase [Pyrenophora seminiperda CCB06]
MYTADSYKLTTFFKRHGTFDFRRFRPRHPTSSVAYKGSPLAPLLAPGPFPPDAAQRRARDLAELRRNDPNVHYLQCRDEATGDMVAFCKYLVVQNSDDAVTPAPLPPPQPGWNEEATLMFRACLEKRKKEILGNRPHVYLNMLHTNPNHQGRGAGGLLLNSCIKRADELRLPIYLESSAAGHRFYQNRGFKDVEVCPVDFRPFGGPLHEQPLMLYEPST